MRSTFVGTRLTHLALLLAAATTIGCGGGGSAGAVTGPPPPPPVASGNTTSLTITNNHFSPAQDSVGVGANVTWTWNSCSGDGYGGSTCTSHSVQFDDSGPSSSIKSSGTFSRMFANAGSYTYHCAVHGLAMSGTITVH